METPLSEKNLIKSGFREHESVNHVSEVRLFKKNTVFMIFIEKGSCGYLILRDSASNILQYRSIFTLKQLKTEYFNLAGEELLIYNFSDN
jgi:hypothetical protein